jgi:hypothetical protein
MRRIGIQLIIVGCLSGIMLACFARALFHNEQFGYRDAAHYYYPLYLRVQSAWNEGRWPLWESEENSGMPLMGNPTAAVLYPGKLIYAVMPYAWGARIYIIAHVLLACAAMMALLRTWNTSWTGSAIGAFAYAFGAPVLFQYCNVIYLVGAAWAPLGFRAVDRWLRLGRRGALLELGVVLAMETLGGDPQTAYLTGVCAGGYAVALAGARAGSTSAPRRLGRWSWLLLPILGFLVLGWLTGTFVTAKYASLIRTVRGPNQPPDPLPWVRWVSTLVAVVWMCVAVWLSSSWRRRRSDFARLLVPMLAGLGMSAVVALMLSSAQLLPVLEFTGQSARAAGAGPHDIFPFSLEPVRVVEFFWPNVFGTVFHGNRSWLLALNTAPKAAKIWVPSLYLGGLTIALALGGLRIRGAAPWRAWLSVIAIGSLVLSLGEYSSPIFWGRYIPSVAREIGPHDSQTDAALRFDRHLRDGDGGLYWLMATFLPGFRQFRYPSKLLTLTVLALAALAGLAWDDLAGGDARQRRRMVCLAASLLVASVLALTCAMIGRTEFIGWLASKSLSSSIGPHDPAGSHRELMWALGQGGLVAMGALALAIWATRRPGLAAGCALLLVTTDLAVANSRYILTVPQRLFDETPKVVQIIAEEEAKNPSPGPFRVHRLPVWNPYVWGDQTSEDRVRDFVRWERATIQPKYGITEGIAYTLAIGVAELYDYEWFFGGFYRKLDSGNARYLGGTPGQEIVVYPRRATDLWTARYFVLPMYPAKWKDENRGFASFLENSERVYPHPDAFKGPDGVEKEMAWVRSEDFQVRRNLTTYPRAWVVHRARYLQPITGLDRGDRDKPMEEILFSNDYLWRDATRVVYDPRQVAWIESERRSELREYLSGSVASANETVTVTRYEPELVELDAVLDRPGLVVLADVYYPGWSLTIDGEPAPIYRANRMMRGAAVKSGKHHLVYEYSPLSFRTGLVLSVAGLASLTVLGVVFAVRPLASWQAVPSSDEPEPEP